MSAALVSSVSEQAKRAVRALNRLCRVSKEEQRFIDADRSIDAGEWSDPQRSMLEEHEFDERIEKVAQRFGISAATLYEACEELCWYEVFCMTSPKQ